jgi:small-conductance mechanosensitive channel
MVILVGILVALDLLDATALVGAVVGTAGLAGLAVGFAFKDIVENYLAGTILAFRQPFAKNDQIRIESYEGKVVRLTARETILMTLDGNHVRLPNALVFRSPMLNFTRNPLRRFEFEAGLGTGDDLAQAREVAVSALSSMEGVLEDPAPEVLVTTLGDSTVTVVFRGWVDQSAAEFNRVRSEAIRLVKARLEEAGHTMPSPAYIVEMDAEQRPKKTAVEASQAPAATTTLADVAVDRSVDRQIEADRQASSEDDLLDRSGSGGPT